MSQFSIEINAGKIDAALLNIGGQPRADLVAAMDGGGHILAGMLDEKNIAVCAVQRKPAYDDIVYWSVLPDYRGKGYGRELLLYTLDYLQVLGNRAVEIGASNADVRLFSFYQALGFRVVGVVPDYFAGEDVPVHNGRVIKARDRLRYRINPDDVRA